MATELGSVLDAEGWFATKDVATLGDAGYLFIDDPEGDQLIVAGVVPAIDTIPQPDELARVCQ